MADGINVGSVYVDVLPDARQFNTRLAEIARNAAITVKVDADTRAAEMRIAALDGGDVTIRANLDDEEAAIRLDELTRDRDATINVNADTAGAAAKIDALSQSANNAGGGLGFLKTTAIALSPALVPVAAAAAGVAAALVSLGAAGVAGAGIMAIAFGGVSSAVKLLGQQQTQEAAAAQAAGQSAAAHAAAVVAAQRQIESARMSLADAERAASDQQIQDSQAVAAAQYSLQQADQQETNAVNALVTAREAAARQLESYANQAKDAALAQRQSVLDLQTAQANYNQTMASSSSTAQQRAQAELDLEKAQQRVVEAQQAATNAAQDNQKAQKAGVDGAPQVVAATQQVASAKHNQQQAEQNLANAQRKAAEDQIKSQESIVRAQQGVAAAMDAMAAAQRQAAGSSNAALAATNAQIAKLDPATRSFAQYLRGTWAPIWDKVKSAAAGGLLPGVQSALESVRPLMPGFISFISDLSQRMGDLAKEAGQALSGPFWTKFFNFVQQVAGPSLSALGHILGNLAQGFAGLLMGMKPLIQPVIDGIVTLSQKFADFGTQASTSKGFGQFIKYIQDNLPIIERVVGNILKAVGEAVVGLAPLGTAILKLLDPLAKFLANDVIPFLAPIVRFIAEQVAPVFGKLLASAIDGARAAFAWIMKVVQDNRPELEQLWTFIKNDLAPVLGFILKTAFELVGVAIGEVIKIVSRMIDWWNTLWQVGKDIGAWFSGPFVNFFVGAWNAIRNGWQTLVQDIKNLWQDIKHWVMDPVAWVVKYVIDDGLIGAWDWISDHLLGGALHANTIPVPAVPPLAAATGGVIPGYAPGVDSVHAVLSPGEGILVPEAVRGLGGAPAIHAINSQFSNRVPGTGGTHFAGGGIIGDIIGVITDPVGTLTSGLKSLMAGIGKAGPFIDMLGQMVGGLAKGVGQAVENLLFGGGTGYNNVALGGNNGANLAGAAGMGNIGLLANLGAGGAARWRPVVDQVLAALGLPLSIDGGVLNIIQHESGGNPAAINLSDSNARAGHPSQGLMQTIPSTFYAYAGPFASRGIDDPFANIYAGVNYALHTYGIGMLAAGGRSYGGRYIGYDSGGPLPPGPSLVYNGTGHNELIAPAQTFKEAFAGLNPSTGTGASSEVAGIMVKDGGTLMLADPAAQERMTRQNTRRALIQYGMR